MPAALPSKNSKVAQPRTSNGLGTIPSRPPKLLGAKRMPYRVVSSMRKLVSTKSFPKAWRNYRLVRTTYVSSWVR